MSLDRHAVNYNIIDEEATAMLYFYIIFYQVVFGKKSKKTIWDERIVLSYIKYLTSTSAKLHYL